MDTLLTPDQQKYIEDNVLPDTSNAMPNSLLSPDQYEYIVQKNKEVFSRPIPQDTPLSRLDNVRHTPSLLFSNQTNLVADASLDLGTLPENPTADEAYEYNKKAERKRRAQLMLNVLNYQMYTDPKKALDAQKQTAVLNLGFALTPEQTQQLSSQIASKVYEDTVNEFGLMPDNIMSDPMFYRFVGAEDYMYFKTLRDMQEEANGTTGFFEGIGRSIDYAAAQRDLELKFFNGEIQSLQELDALSFVNEYKYKRRSDGLSEEVAQVTYDMLAPVWYNLDTVAATGLGGASLGAGFGSVVPGVGNVIGAGAVGLKTAGLAAMAAIGAETTQRYQAQIAIEAMRKDPNLTRDQALNSALPEALFMSGLDLAGDAASGFIFGRAGSKLVRNLSSKAIRDAGDAAAGQAVQNQIQSRILTSLGEAFKDFSKIWGSEVITEGLQGSIQQGAINRLSGENYTEGMGNAFVENAKQAARVMVVFGLIGASPRFINTYMDMGRAGEAIKKADNIIKTADTIANSPITKNNPEVANVLFNKVLNGRKVYISVSRFKEFLDDSGIPYNTLPAKFRDLDKMVETDPNSQIELTMAELFTKYWTAKNGGALVKFLRTSPDSMNLDEAKSVFEDIMPFEETVAQIRADREAMKAQQLEKQTVKNDIFNAFASSGIANQEQADMVSDFAANMYQSLADDMGISVTEAYNLNKLTISKAPNTLNLSGKENIQNQEGARAWFDPQSMAIVYKSDAKLSSIMHEFAHAYLTMLSNAAKAYNTQAIQERYTAFNRAYGLKKDFNSLSDKQKTVIQEKFAANFLQSFLRNNENLPPEQQKLFQSFRKIISSALKREYKSIFDANRARYIQQRNAQKLQQENARRAEAGEELLPEGYFDSQNLSTEETNALVSDLIDTEYRAQMNQWLNENPDVVLENNLDANLPTINDELNQFFQSIAWSEDLKNSINDNLEIDTVLKELVDTNLSPEDIQAIQELSNQYQEMDLKAQQSTDSLIQLMVQSSLKTAKSLEEVKKAFDELKGDLSDKKWNEQINSFYQLYAKVYKERIEHIKLARQDAFIQSIGNLILDRSEAIRRLPQAVFKRLESQGRIAPKGKSGYTFKMIQDEYYGARKTALLRSDLMDSSIKTDEDMYDSAADSAFEAVNKAVINGNLYTASIEALTLDLRRKIGAKEITLLNKMLGKGADKKARLNIFNDIASIDLSNTAYRDLKPQHFKRQADKARKVAQKHIAKGDLNAAVDALNLEQAYLAKASLAASYQKEFTDSLQKIKTFAQRGNKKLAGNYDMNHIEVLRALLARIGLFNRVNADRALDQVKQYSPDVYKDCEELFSDPKFNQYYSNMTLSDLNKVINTLYSLRSHASFMR